MQGQARPFSGQEEQGGEVLGENIATVKTEKGNRSFRT